MDLRTLTFPAPVEHCNLRHFPIPGCFQRQRKLTPELDSNLGDMIFWYPLEKKLNLVEIAV